MALHHFDTVGHVEGQLTADMQQAIQHEIESRTEASVLPGLPRCAVAPGDRDATLESCVQEHAKPAGASHAIAGAVGGIDRIYVVQLKLLDVSKGSVTRSLEETINRDDPERKQVSASLASRLLNLPERTPWWRRWWIWTAVGVAVSAAVAIPVGLQSADSFEEVVLPGPP